MERTATRRVFTFQMIKPLSLRAMLALGGRRSSCSRSTLAAALPAEEIAQGDDSLRRLGRCQVCLKLR